MSEHADLNATLIDAVENGDLAKVHRAIELGADPACITPAHIPPQQETDEHYEIMKYLFSVGTDVNFAGFDEGILMTFSAYRGQLRYLRLYLDAGADINGNYIRKCHALNVPHPLAPTGAAFL